MGKKDGAQKRLGVRPKNRQIAADQQGGREARRAHTRKQGGISALRKESTIARKVHDLCADCSGGFANCVCCKRGHETNTPPL